MKLLLDNLSPRIARALHELFKPDHEIVALRDRFPENISDTAYIAALHGEGGWAVLTRDLRIRTRPNERAAVIPGRSAPARRTLAIRGGRKGIQRKMPSRSDAFSGRRGPGRAQGAASPRFCDAGSPSPLHFVLRPGMTPGSASARLLTVAPADL